MDIEIRDFDSVKCRLEGVTQIAVTCAALSACGKFCAVLTGLPEFELKIFNLETKEIIAQTTFSNASEETKILFNPDDWRSFCVYDR